VATAPKRRRAAKPAPLFTRAEEADLTALAERFPCVVDAMRYARAVARGQIDACRWVVLAAQRFESDTEKSLTEKWPFRFDILLAERACQRMQSFREVKGPKSGQYLELAPWQRFFVCNVFGWVHKETGARRFRYALLYVPRGNGKTTLAAPLALHMLALDKEGGAEVYAAAVTRQQARLVFDVARFMAQREKDFLAVADVEVTTNSVVQHSTASVFRPLSKDAGTMDGLNVHLAVLDELAQHPTREVHDVLQTATGKRRQPLMLGITTASTNKTGVGFEQWAYAQKVLAGDVVDDQYFALLYTVDPDDDWTSPAVWRKANPNWGVSVMPDAIAALAARAMQVPAQQNAFKQKHLNIWTSAESAWMNMEYWRAAGDATLREEDFAGQRCILAVDLASKTDLIAKAKLFSREVDGVLHYYAFVDFWLPQATIDKAAEHNAPYPDWVKGGWVKAMPGETNNFNEVEQSVLADAEAFEIEDLAYDAWQALQLANNLETAGVPVIEYRPTVQNFSPPMKEIDALVREKRFHHNANPALDFCVSCVLVQEDMKGNIFPRKNKADKSQKIDGLVALVMAMGRRMAIDADASDPEILSL
jgi:phage terminase large subunit-like protein